MGENSTHTLAIGQEINSTFNKKGWTLYRLNGAFDSFDLFSQGPARDILYNPVLNKKSPFYTPMPLHPDQNDPVKMQFYVDSLEARGLYPPRLEKQDMSKSPLPFIALTFDSQGIIILGSYDSKRG